VLEEQRQLLTILLQGRLSLMVMPQCRPLKENYTTFGTKEGKCHYYCPEKKASDIL